MFKFSDFDYRTLCFPTQNPKFDYALVIPRRHVSKRDWDKFRAFIDLVEEAMFDNDGLEVDEALDRVERGDSAPAPSANTEKG